MAGHDRWGIFQLIIDCFIILITQQVLSLGKKFSLNIRQYGWRDNGDIEIMLGNLNTKC